jgi:anti-sigma factor RsiW
MSPFRRRKNRADSTSTQPDYLEELLAQRADVGTSEDDVKAVEKADADRAAEQTRIAQFVKTEEILDRNAPRPSVRDTPL